MLGKSTLEKSTLNADNGVNCILSLIFNFNFNIWFNLYNTFFSTMKIKKKRKWSLFKSIFSLSSDKRQKLQPFFSFFVITILKGTICAAWGCYCILVWIWTFWGSTWLSNVIESASVGPFNQSFSHLIRTRIALVNETCVATRSYVEDTITTFWGSNWLLTVISPN